jgi:hypothetical protein
VKRDLRAALPGWIAARVLVAVGWLAAKTWVAIARDGVEPVPMLQGLLAWDGAFYEGIAEHGYDGEPFQALRFFPGLPLAARAVGVVLGGDEDLAIVVIANLAALLAGALVARLVRVDGLGDERTATRAATLLALVPPAFVLVWGYADAVYLVLSTAMFVAIARDRWWTAAAAGVLAAVVRPTGVLLALAALVAGLAARRGSVAARATAVLAPLAGAGAYLWWVERTRGDWYAPIRLQDQLRSGFVDPFTRFAEAAGELVGSERFSDGLHVPFAVALVVLAVVAWRRLPTHYGVYAVAGVVVAVAADNWNSIERYGLDVVPLVVALALVLRTRRAEWIAYVVGGAGLVALSALAWLAEYVP